jgi:carbon-monoxide dehydrogenase large subunit
VTLPRRRWVGRPLLRREDRRLLEGRGRYVDDIDLPGLLHVRFARSPLPHGLLGGSDTAAARAAAGVIAVVTGSDIAKDVAPFPQRLTFLRPITYHPLAVERVRFVGEPFAAVVAASEVAAEDAAELVDAAIDPLPVLMSATDALASSAPRLYPEWEDNVLVHRSASYGDVEGAFAAADVVIDETFHMQRQAAVPLETRGCVASYDGNLLTIWSSTQMPHFLRSTVAEILRVPEARVRVIVPDVGGGFGLKYQVYREEALVAYLTMRLGRPVKWREDIREHLAASTHARDKTVRCEMAATADGRILGLRASIVVDVGSAMAFPYSHGSTLVLAGGLPLALKTENYAYDYRCVVTNKAPVGAYRGFGNNMRVFVIERSLDLLAERLGMDRAEIRRRNVVSRADLPYRSATGTRITTGTVLEALEKGLDLAAYAGFADRQRTARAEGRYIGIGSASFAETAAPRFFEMAGAGGAIDSAKVRIEQDGSASVAIGVSPQGQGHETMIAQVVADELGLDPDAVAVRHGDTAVAPYGIGAWGSRSAVVAGGAAIMACGRLREKVLTIAAHLTQRAPERWRLEDGRVVDRDGQAIASLREIADAAYAGRARLPAEMEPGLEATAYFEPASVDAKPDAEGRAMRHGTVSNQAHVVTVEVVPATGEVRILDYVVVHDCGTMINPLMVDGQIRGGVFQGIAGTLHEEIVYDEDGQLLTGSLIEYHVPTAKEIPSVRIEHLSSPDTTVPGGFKGMAEGGTIGAPAAIASAVADALRPFDVNITTTALSPIKLWQLIERSRGRAREPALGREK